MIEFMDQMVTNYKATARMTLFNYFKTDNPAYDAIITTIIMSLFGYIINYIYDYRFDKIIMHFSFDSIKSIFFKKNQIVIEGKRSSVVSAYSSVLNTSSIYSDRFKAIWCYIINNIENNDSIQSIKESHSNFQSSDDEKRKNLDIFMVYQNKHFIIDKDIFVNAKIEQEESNDEKTKTNSRTDKITVIIYSYKYSLSYLKNYVDNITDKYLYSIKENRTNKKFIYFLDKAEKSDDESFLTCWREDLFESARTFNNIFFDGKKEIISKIDYFLNNKDWYYQKGIPYSLGIGLHGPPGTGKTSFIKALANYTNRHIIVISLKIIKTKRQLEQFFFEDKYNENNAKGDISFDKKIIVFEDIDCIGDIVLNRSLKNEKNKIVEKDKSVNIGDVLQSICELNESGTTKVSTLTNKPDELITLDDILNLWDGIRETPGRILVISSNHYEKLDPALVRPGRIDITHELNNASHNVISEMYTHLFEKNIDVETLKKVKEYYYSPAEIINMYVSYKNECDFVNRLLENRK
jgi:hypothetical protein